MKHLSPKPRALRAAAYYVIPRLGLLRAIYANTALSTVALVFGFLMADQAVPFVLIATVCGLSRLTKWSTTFMTSV